MRTSVGEIFKIDKEFHLSLAQITGNRIHESVLYTMYDNINRYFERFLSEDITILGDTYKELCKITEAIEKGNPNKARIFLQEHVRRYYQIMEKKRGGGND